MHLERFFTEKSLEEPCRTGLERSENLRKKGQDLSFANQPRESVLVLLVQYREEPGGAKTAQSCRQHPTKHGREPAGK